MLTFDLRTAGTAKLFLGFILLSFVFSSPAWACTIHPGWEQSGSGLATLPRYSGKCGYQALALGDTLTHTLSADVSTYTVAFYALTKFNANSTASHSVTIFRAFDNGGTKLELKVKGNKTAELKVGGTVLTGAINVPAKHYNGWNHYKAVWDGIDVTFFINGVQASGSANMSGAIDQQQIGHIASAAPNLALNLAFDHFISLLVDDPSQTDVLCPGDTDNSGSRAQADLFNVFTEISTSQNTLAQGQPDIDGTGHIGQADLFFIFDAIATAQSTCP